MKQVSEDRISFLMKSLELTREEALEVIQFDEGELENEEADRITEKAKEVQKTEIKRGRKPGTKMAGVTQQTKKKKENPTKANLISIIEKALQSEGMDLKVLNPEKTISIQIGDDTFEIDLKQKRKPKA